MVGVLLNHFYLRESPQKAIVYLQVDFRHFCIRHFCDSTFFGFYIFVFSRFMFRGYYFDNFVIDINVFVLITCYRQKECIFTISSYLSICILVSWYILSYTYPVKLISRQTNTYPVILLLSRQGRFHSTGSF